MKRVLHIGRFQPFHLGHLDAVHQAMQEAERLIIAIGSAEDSFLPDNPFTAGERFQMIEETLEAEGIERYDIIPIRNIHNYSVWVQHVETLLPPFDVVYTGSKIVKTLFLQHGKYQIRDIKKIKDISATRVREAMKNNGPWESMVPKPVAAFIQKINGVERLKSL